METLHGVEVLTGLLQLQQDSLLSMPLRLAIDSWAKGFRITATLSHTHAMDLSKSHQASQNRRYKGLGFKGTSAPQVKVAKTACDQRIPSTSRPRPRI